MKSFCKYVEDKKQWWELKKWTVFCIEACILTEFKEPSDILRQKNITEGIFYAAFYDDTMASGFHDFLGHVIQYCVTDIHGFFRNTIVEKKTWLEGKIVNFSKLAVPFGD